MTVAKRNKRVKPDPELVKLAHSLLANYQKPEDLIGENSLLKQLTKLLLERALDTEMSEHLGHGKSEAVTNATATPVTATAPRRCRASLGSWHSIFHVIARARSSRSCLLQIEAGLFEGLPGLSPEVTLSRHTILHKINSIGPIFQCWCGLRG